LKCSSVDADDDDDDAAAVAAAPAGEAPIATDDDVVPSSGGPIRAKLTMLIFFRIFSSFFDVAALIKQRILNLEQTSARRTKKHQAWQEN
jgi:hypothetical protein